MERGGERRDRRKGKGERGDQNEGEGRERWRGREGSYMKSGIMIFFMLMARIQMRRQERL